MPLGVAVPLSEAGAQVTSGCALTGTRPPPRTKADTCRQETGCASMQPGKRHNAGSTHTHACARRALPEAHAGPTPPAACPQPCGSVVPQRCCPCPALPCGESAGSSAGWGCGSSSAPAGLRLWEDEHQPLPGSLCSYQEGMGTRQAPSLAQRFFDCIIETKGTRGTKTSGTDAPITGTASAPQAPTSSAANTFHAWLAEN